MKSKLGWSKCLDLFVPLSFYALCMEKMKIYELYILIAPSSIHATFPAPTFLPTLPLLIKTMYTHGWIDFQLELYGSSNWQLRSYISDVVKFCEKKGNESLIKCLVF